VDLTLMYWTVDDTATNGSDYTLVAATNVTIPAGATSINVTLDVIGDTVLEGDEDFDVNFVLFLPDGTNISSATATVTITDDDVGPRRRPPAPGRARRSKSRSFGSLMRDRHRGESSRARLPRPQPRLLSLRSPAAVPPRPR
jgi:hypothetical protein